MDTDGWSVGSVAVSAVTFWEITILAESNRLEPGCDPGPLASDRIADGLRELPLHGTEAVRAALRNARVSTETHAGVSGSRLGNPDSRRCGRCGHLRVPFETTDDDRTILRRVCADPIALGID